jgi:hypothetical protein
VSATEEGGTVVLSTRTDTESETDPVAATTHVDPV